MSVNLSKGQKVSLTKENAGLKRVIVGLGWDEAPGYSDTIDCDAIAMILGANGKLAYKQDVVFFNNLRHPSGCVVHQGDNLTGAGAGDDEQIMVDLAKLPPQFERISVLVSIYKARDKMQHFGMIKNAFIRLVDADTNKELYRYDLTENYSGMTAMVFGEVYRHNGEWKFSAIGQGLQVWAVADLAAKYGLDPSVWARG